MRRSAAAVATAVLVALLVAPAAASCTSTAEMGADGAAVGTPPPQVFPGGSLTLHGTGFGVYPDNRTVDIRWGFDGPSLGAATVADDGSWTLTIGIPSDVQPGLYILNADAHDDAGFVVTQAVTVVAPATTAPAAQTEEVAAVRHGNYRQPPTSRTNAKVVARPRPERTSGATRRAARPSPVRARHITATPNPVPARPRITQPRLAAPRAVMNQRLEPGDVVATEHVHHPPPWRWIALAALLVATAVASLVPRRWPRRSVDALEAELQAIIAEELRRRAERESTLSSRGRDANLHSYSEGGGREPERS